MAKGFCILRVEKIKQAGGVAVALGHNTREREPRNASPELKDKNQIIGPKSVEEGMSRFRGLVSRDKKPRKNAVLCLEYLVTATNKSLATKERTEYLNAALKWIQKRHGAENVLQVALHRDENTDAHMHVLVVPLVKTERGIKLNASRWLDGKKKLTEMQTEFAKEVGEKFDLARGVEGSIAKHEKVKKFYGLVNEQGQKPKIEIPRPPRLGALYDLDEWKTNVEKMVLKQITPVFENLNARSGRLVMAEKELYNAKASLYKSESENRTLRKENTRLREILTEAPLSEIQRMRDEVRQKQEREKKTLERQKRQERGRGGISR